MASRFLSSLEDEIRQLLEEKDSENTKRTFKAAQQVFHEYLVEKEIKEPTEKSKIARVSKRFYVEARRKDGSAYTIKIQCITLTSTLIIPHITKTSSNNCLLNKGEVMKRHC